MLLLVIENGTTQAELIKFGAPKFKVVSVSTPISKSSTNAFGRGGTNIATAMRAAMRTKRWIGARPYFYLVPNEAGVATSAMRKVGKNLRTFPINEAMFTKALFLADMFCYSDLFSEKHWQSKGFYKTKAQYDERFQVWEDKTTDYLMKIYDKGQDAAALVDEGMELAAYFAENSLPDSILTEISKNAYQSTKIAAYILQEALKVKPND